MKFAIGQNVWFLTSSDPTLIWEEGVIVEEFKGHYEADRYSVALADSTIIFGVCAFNSETQRYRLRPFFVTSPSKPTNDSHF